MFLLFYFLFITYLFYAFIYIWMIYRLSWTFFYVSELLLLLSLHALN